MIFGEDRQELRRMYVDAWRKAREGSVLSPLEAQIAEVIADHPEYHGAVKGDDLDQSYAPDDGRTNPFLHMGLHLALRDQVATDRPAGIRAVFQAIANRASDQLDAEHLAIECLAETLWEAQTQNKAPDEQQYLERLKRLARRVPTCNIHAR
jgi:hypothetical protein